MSSLVSILLITLLTASAQSSNYPVGSNFQEKPGTPLHLSSYALYLLWRSICWPIPWYFFTVSIVVDAKHQLQLLLQQESAN